MIRKNNENFILENNEISYIFKILENGQLGHVYFGKKLKLFKNTENVQRHNDNSSLNSRLRSVNEPIMNNCRLQEFSDQEAGDLRLPSISCLFKGRDNKTQFRYKNYKIVEGEFETKEFPEARKGIGSETLEVELYDEIHNISLFLYYTVYSNSNCIVKSSKIVNNSNSSIVVDNLVSLNFDSNKKLENILTLQGDWEREFDFVEQKLERGIFTLNSNCGHSSAYATPFIALSDNKYSREYGEIYSALFIYSGNYDLSVERNSYGSTRLTSAINKDTIKIKLEPNEKFKTPETALFYADGGLDAMSHNHHTFIRNNIISQQQKDKHNHIIVNSWEAMSFDVNKEKLIKLVDKANEIDAEMFVIDDGWFTGRDDDTTSLGDWDIDLTKFPNDEFMEVSEYVKKRGMKFGLWFEPEMINEKSKLYEEHPEWVLGSSSSELTLGRYQLVLDMGNPDVVNYLFEKIERIISKYGIDYVKWDMNRNITEANSIYTSSADSRIETYEHMRGVYKLIYRLTKRFPNLILEGCASGGNRFDLGILYYMPQNWLSDNTDAIRRVKSQYGASLVYPLSVQDNSVTETISCMGRYIPLETRMNVASFGNFGYTYELNESSSEDFKQMKEFNNFYKTIRTLMQTGRYFAELYDDKVSYTTWSVVSPNKDEVYACTFRLNEDINTIPYYVKFKGLDPEFLYEEVSTGAKYYGDYLMEIGIPLKTLFDDKVYYKSYTLHFKQSNI